MRKKVLLITTEYPNCQEPVRSVFIRERMLFLRDFVDVKIVAPVLWVPPFVPSITKKIPPREERDGIEIFHPRIIAIPKVGRFISGFLYFICVFFTVLQIRKGFAFDVIYSIWTYPDGFASTLLGKFLKKPVLMFSMGCDINHYPSSYILRQWIKFALKNCSRIVSVSDGIKRGVLKLGIPGHKVITIRNGVNVSEFFPRDTIESRGKLGLAEGDRVILFIGRLSEEKGLTYLIQAMKNLKDFNIEGLKLYIIGEGKLKRDIEKQIEESRLGSQVRLVGAVEHSLIPVWINAADIICLPSLREGCPNIVLESMACGKPVVASNVGGVPELVSSDEHGILVSPADPRALAQAIQKAMMIDWDRSRIALKGAERSWKSVAEELYQELRALCVDHESVLDPQISEYGISNDIGAFLDSNYRLACEREENKPSYLQQIIAKNSRADYILDIGCGVGGDLHILKKEGFSNLYGVELLFDALQFARKTFCLSSVVQANCERLPYRSNTFDCCVATNIIEHIVYPNKLLKEINRVLKNDGQAVITVPRAASASDRILRWGGMILHGKTSHIQKFDLKKARSLFHDNHFIIIEEKEIRGFELDNPLFRNSCFLKHVYRLLVVVLRNELNGWRFTLKKEWCN
ncbi:MAG: putative teichuronic acid biosynthesis glycosyltransferase TuaC [Pelotomaculum sp. PtaU1.Bin065]|nr:MAG: putative teichuronic acid biosynthesis glycosyltransferase TuaC [Pelotomaculum sp. PtaU1.Bin065]